MTQKYFSILSAIALVISQLLLTGTANAKSASTPPSVLQLPHEMVTLPNGLKIFLVRYPSPGAVAYQLLVRAGSRNEIEKGKTGFAHFFEHLMFKGTKKMSAKEFGDLYTKLGCENNAETSNDYTRFHGMVASVYLPKILATEAERFKHLWFDEKALRDEAGAVRGEYNKDAAQPEFQLEEKLMATAFTKHPYSHTTMGYKEDVLQYTERYNDVWPFFKRYYRPENTFITLVGDIEFAPTIALIKKEFGDWKGEPIEPVVIPTEPEQTEPRQAEVTLDKPSQTRVVIAYKVPAFTTDNTDMAALSLISELLFSVTSSFQKEFHFEKKWLDSIGTAGQQWVHPGIWEIWLRFTQTGEGKDAAVLQAIDQAIQKLRTTPPTVAELAVLKKRFRNEALAHWFSSPDGLASTLGYYANFETDFGVLDRVLSRVEEVTPAMLTEFARKNLTEAHKTTVFLKGAQQ